ncbi:hypothetical protein AVEN_28666-1 [Araneus ventricosus]|uniref:Uncharacterized protein n=1 Tax=Araneus ventricosus TaxID=182803 RepID=A0A4Y2P6A9_ARAVE|nr:hypothetical protein AVEN_28666-1 [Araneus ventricosus]
MYLYTIPICGRETKIPGRSEKSPYLYKRENLLRNLRNSTEAIGRWPPAQTKHETLAYSNTHFNIAPTFDWKARITEGSNGSILKVFSPSSIVTKEKQSYFCKFFSEKRSKHTIRLRLRNKNAY